MDNKPKFKPLVVIQCYEERQNRIKPVERRPAPLCNNETPQEKSPDRQTTADLDLSLPPPPPPPPPVDANSNILQPEPPKPKPKTAPPVPVKYSTLSYAKEQADYFQPPPCPTPDYDTISLNSTYSKSTFSRSDSSTSQSDAIIEMDSIDSIQLNNPSTLRPKHPNTYFKSPLTQQLSNGSTTSTSTIGSRKQRPVSVTIGEYPSGSLRRQPGRLDFLSNCNGDAERSPGEPITTQFASELAHTLSRSNLRRRTESMENMLNSPQIQPQTNGSVTISLSNGNRGFDKTDSSSVKSTDNKSNRVTINICSLDKKTDLPNGILKNGNGNHNFHNTNHKTLVQQKSITFGEMPTVINDQLLQIS